MDEWPPARLLNEQDDDDDHIDSTDDEELDSDAAFDESNDEQFAGFFSSKKNQKNRNKKPAVRFADVDLNEDEDMASEEEEEEDGDPDEFIDLLDVLDGKGEIDMDSDNDKPVWSLNSDEDQSEEDSAEEDDDQHEDDQDAFAPSEEEEPIEASDEFQKFISSLDTTAKKRKADDGEPGAAMDSQSRKRRLIAERTEAGAEDEFRAHASGSKLQLDDLLAPLSSQSSNLLTLKKNTKVLSSASTKVKTLSAPLPYRAQERLDREAAYEQTKEEVDKWSATMKRIREAEHLSFPLQTQSSGRVSNLELAAKFKPSTKLESSVDSLLKSAKLREEDLFQTEDNLLKSNSVTIEEISKRRSELRHMRELMFRAELKAKRINKIKSKTYRKIKRKEKEKLKEKMLEAEAGGDSDIEGDMLKREVERARERATLKHKQTGKWAKRMKQQDYLDENGREQIEEMLQRGEQLRRKIQGLGDDESGEEESSSDDNSGEEVDVDTEQGILRIKKAAFDELQQLEDEPTETDSNQKQRGVFQMKFMKEAMARKQAATDRLMDDFIKEMDADVNNSSSGSEEDERNDEVDISSGILTNRSGGRMAYRPGVPQSLPLPRTMNSLASDTSSVTLRSADFGSTTTSSPPIPPSSGLSHITAAPPSNPLSSRDESNPWLTRNSDTSTKIARKKNEVFGKDSQKSEKSKNKLKKLARKRQEEKEKAQEDARVEISMDQNLVLDDPSSSRKSQISTSTSKPITGTGVNATTPANEIILEPGDSSDDANSELDAQEASLLRTRQDANPKGLKAFQQRDLVALAFAGDNVVHEFDEAKKREIAADAPKDVDTTIPGWGSWGGEGLQKAPPKPERIKKIAGVDPKSRADYNKKGIIISEKRDKKAAKYIVKDLPYPYTSRAQFERSMEQPLGKEWNTRVGFQRGTLPRVVKKPGIIIDPLEKMA